MSKSYPKQQLTHQLPNMSALNAIYATPSSVLHFDHLLSCWNQFVPETILEMIIKGNHNYKVQAMSIQTDTVILSSIWHYTQGHFFTSL